MWCDMAGSKLASSSMKNTTKKATGTLASTTKQTIYREDRGSSNLEGRINNSMRLFGIPHQFTAENDPRIGSGTNLGRCFAERIIMEAPIIALKPGKPKFLPGMSDSEKANFLSRIQTAIGSNSSVESES